MSYSKYAPLKFWISLFAICAAFFLLLLPRLSEGTLFHTDECLTAERARAMLLLGDYTTVYLNFKPNFNKPPLQYYLTTFSMRLIDDPELCVRIWSLVYATVCLALTALLYLQLRPAAWSEALWPAIALAGYGYWIDNARIALLDMGLTFFILCVLIAVLRAQQAPRWWLLAGLAAGLGAWQKNSIPVIIFLGLGVMSLSARDVRSDFQRRRWILLGAALAIVLYVVWPLLQGMRYPEAYLQMLHREGTRLVFERKDAMIATVSPRFSYIGWILEKWLVFGALALLSLPIIFSMHRLRAQTSLRKVALVALIYLLILSFFAVWHKYYMLPVLPLLAICGVYWVFDSCAHMGWRRWLAHSIMALVLMPVLVIGAFHGLRPTRDYTAQIQCARDAMQAQKPDAAFCLIGKAHDLQSLFFHQIAYYLKFREHVAFYRMDQLHKLPQGTLLYGIVHLSRQRELEQWTEGLRPISRHGDYIVFEARRNSAW